MPEDIVLHGSGKGYGPPERLRVWAGVGLLIGALTGNAGAGDRKAGRDIVMGGDGRYPPFQFLDEQGRPQGFDVELLTAIAGIAGLDVQARLGDWDAALEALEQGSVHVVPMFVSPERADRYRFTAPYLTVYHEVYSRPGRGPVNSLEQLRGSTVAVQRGGYAHDQLRSRVPGARLVLSDSEPETLTLVLAGMADYALLPKHIADHTIRSRGLQGLVPVSPPLLQTDAAFAVTAGSPYLVGLLNAGLAVARERGITGELTERWLVPQGRVGFAEAVRWAAWVIVPLGSALVVVGAWTWMLRRAVNDRTTALQAELKQRRRAEREVLRLAYQDDLTELPNERSFLRRLRESLADSRDRGRRQAVLKIAALNLEEISHALGFDLRDAAVRALGRRLRDTIGPGEYLSRLEPDSFGLLLEDLPAVSDAVHRARELEAVLEAPLRLQDGSALVVRVGIGIALCPEHAADAGLLLRRSDIARRAGREREKAVMVFDEAHEVDPARVKLLADLRRAIQQRELVVHYQPKIGLADGRPRGAEALVRWQSRNKGMIPPGEFIPVAETSGLITDLTLCVLQRVFEDRRLLSRDCASLSTAVNISTRDLVKPEFSDGVWDMLGREGEAESRLIFEITETSAMTDLHTTLEAAAAFRELGVGIAIDDFGTGYASLSYLQRLRPDELKIDRSFVAGMVSDAGDAFMVRSTIGLAHGLGMDTTAEGVETEEQRQALREMGCCFAQGFGIAKPMPAASYLDWLKALRRT